MKVRIFLSILAVLGVSCFAASKVAAQTSQTRCEEQLSQISARMDELVRISANLSGAFNIIAMQVRTYYIDYLVPDNRGLGSFDSLAQATINQQALLESAWTRARLRAENFSCLGNPKTQINQFVTDMRAVKNALIQYRSAIRSLIVAVNRIAPPLTDTIQLQRGSTQ